MKRFLIALLSCLVPFSARANLLWDIYDAIFGGDSEVTVNVVQETEVKEEEPKSLVEISLLEKGFTRIDEELRDYIDPDDFEYVKQHAEGFYKGQTRGEAAYRSSSNAIVLSSVSFNKADTQGTIHHEVSHLKDFMILKENNYDTTIILPSLDKTSRALFGGITEARAYTEEIEFLYKKKNELYEKMEQLEKIIERITQKGAPPSPTMEYQYIKSIIYETFDLLGKEHDYD